MLSRALKQLLMRWWLRRRNDNRRLRYRNDDNLRYRLSDNDGLRFHRRVSVTGVIRGVITLIGAHGGLLAALLIGGDIRLGLKLMVVGCAIAL